VLSIYRYDELVKCQSAQNRKPRRFTCTQSGEVCLVYEKICYVAAVVYSRVDTFRRPSGNANPARLSHISVTLYIIQNRKISYHNTYFACRDRSTGTKTRPDWYYTRNTDEQFTQFGQEIYWFVFLKSCLQVMMCFDHCCIVCTMHLLSALCIYCLYNVSIVCTMYLLFVLCIYCLYYVSIVFTWRRTTFYLGAGRLARNQ
jgi:hypothetical protein